ncbi:MAG: hypothetical protein AVDCRST_MAG91-1332, partial [uncultured Sphingomonadaceae bacterium]
ETVAGDVDQRDRTGAVGDGDLRVDVDVRAPDDPRRERFNHFGALYHHHCRTPFQSSTPVEPGSLSNQPRPLLVNSYLPADEVPASTRRAIGAARGFCFVV